jgi:hypothetical protein
MRWRGGLGCIMLASSITSTKVVRFAGVGGLLANPQEGFYDNINDENKCAKCARALEKEQCKSN